MSKPSIPKGTRDFTPEVMARRQWIFSTLRSAFERRGFQPIETPAMEALTTLTGKYGEEGDQLIFKILNNGDFLGKAQDDTLNARDSKALGFQISKKALRYDLTVPFARFVTMHRNEIPMPFKRYQMQTVWRGDRPGKGRYQEFVQCDADIIGSTGVLCELELVCLFYEALTALKVPQFRILVNDRRILSGMADHLGIGDRLTEWTVAVDKADKVGIEGVCKELGERGFSDRSPRGHPSPVRRPAIGRGGHEDPRRTIPCSGCPRGCCGFGFAVEPRPIRRCPRARARVRTRLGPRIGLLHRSDF